MGLKIVAITISVLLVLLLRYYLFHLSGDRHCTKWYLSHKYRLVKSVGYTVQQEAYKCKRCGDEYQTFGDM